MIPSADEILAGWPFLARRFGVSASPSRASIEAAVRLAIECAADREGDEPAALFYGFARHPRAAPGAWRFLGERLAAAHGARLGIEIMASAEELAALRSRSPRAALTAPQSRRGSPLACADADSRASFPTR